jgi:bifunctional DNase/RNase
MLALLGGVAAAGPVEVEVRGLGFDAETGTPVVRLVEKAATGASARELPIWIGPFEAQAIAMEMQGTPPPRPLTHDLMKQLVERLGGKLQNVVIEDLHDNTFFATLHLEGPAGGLSIDARPSDAIALALRLRGPILVAEEVFAKSDASQPGPAAVHLWGLTVQDLTPEVAAYLEVPAQGVLVSDVAGKAEARAAHRGDVITALDGERVGSVGELRTRAVGRATTEPVRLSVNRSGHEIELSFTPH